MDRLWTIYTTEPSPEGTSPWRSVRIADLPVTSFKMAFRSRAPDEVRLRLETAAPLFAPSDAWQYFEFGKQYWFTCAWLSNGSVRPDKPMFSGTLVKMIPDDSGTSISAELVFLGGWYYLEQTIYHDRGDPSPIASFGYTDGPLVETDAAIRDVIWCAADGEDRGIGFAPSVTPNDITVQDCVSVSSAHLPPFAVNSHTCAEILRRIISFWPNVHTWTDFTKVSFSAAGTPDPRFFVKRIDPDVEDGILSFDCDNPDAVPEGEDPAGCEGAITTFGRGQLISCSYDWIRHPACPGVRVYEVGGPNHGRTYQIGFPDLLGGLTVAIGHDDARDTFMFLNYVYDDGTTIPISRMPDEIFRMLQAPRWQGTVVLSGQDPPGLFALRPNKHLSLGFPGQCPGLQCSPIQSVEFDMGLGRTTMECGWPDSPSPENLISLIKANRYRYQWGIF